ncbi:MAG: hypothetical protein GY941_29305 [Planctomycetes bacterium]|nr:hypothetical protein [Planctomycetota bacterium]
MNSKKFNISDSEPKKHSKFKKISVNNTINEIPSEKTVSAQDSNSKILEPQKMKKKFSPSKFVPQTFNNLMRRLQDTSNLPPIDDSVEKIVLINAQTGTILDSPKLLGFRRNVMAYLISTQMQVEREELICQVKDISTNRVLRLAIAYGAKCPQGNEECLVKALYKHEAPSTAFDQLINRWVQEYYHNKSEHHIDFINEYFELRTDLQTYLVNKALNNTGLDLQVHVSLELELLDLLKPFEMHNMFPIHVTNYDQEIGLTFQGVFDVDEDRKIQAVLEYPNLPTLNNRIIEWVQSFMLHNATIDVFYTHNNTELKQQLSTHLNEKLCTEGRKIIFLQFSSELADSIPPEFFSFKVEFDCTVKDCPSPITVKHELLMDLNKPAKYKLAGIDNLEHWARERLDKITKIVLFEKKYADLILELEAIQRNIKDCIDHDAADIGYTVQHLLVIPNLEPLSLHRDGFRIEETQQFTTKDTNVDVKLSIVLSGKLGDLGSISVYLKPQTNLVEEIKKVLLTSLKDIIHGMDAERFYMRFSYTEMNDEIAVEQLLREAATKQLTEKFLIEDINLIINPVKTDITQRLERLQSGVHSFNFKTTPLRSGENIEFSLKFKVLAVDKNGWYAFQSNHYDSVEDERTAISEVLRDDIKTKLDTVPTEILQYEDINELSEIRIIIELSTEQIKHTFGLMIEIISFHRLLSPSEQIHQIRLSTDRKISLGQDSTRENIADTTNQADHALLVKLYEKRNSILAELEPDDEEELEELKFIKEQIKNIEEKPNFALAGSTQTKYLEQKSEERRNFRLEDYHSSNKPRTGSDNAENTDES